MMTGFSGYHADVPGGTIGVVDYFFSPRPGRGAGPGRRPERKIPPERLIGDPMVFSQVVRALPFQNKYRSGVLSFDAGDIDPSAFNAGDLEARRIVAAILDLHKQTLFPGVPLGARPHLIIGTHTHAGRLELNFAIPQMIRSPDGRMRAYNPEPPTEGARSLWTAARDLINLRFGFADPEDPARKQLVTGPSWRRKRMAADLRDGIGDLDEIDGLITGLPDLAKRLKPSNRDAFVQIVNDQFSSLGMAVIAQTRDSLTIGPAPDEEVRSVRSFRLKGVLCQNMFSLDQLNVHDPLAAAERKSVLETAPDRYAAAWQKAAEFNHKRFGQGAWPTMDFDPEAWLNGSIPPETSLPRCHHLLSTTPIPEDANVQQAPDADGNQPVGLGQPDAFRTPGGAGAPQSADRGIAPGRGDLAFDGRPHGGPDGMADRHSDRLAAALGPRFAPEALSRLAAGLTAVFRWIADHCSGWMAMLRVGRAIPATLTASYANLSQRQEKLHDLITHHPFNTPDRRPDFRNPLPDGAIGAAGRPADGAVVGGNGDDRRGGPTFGGADPATDKRFNRPTLECRGSDDSLWSNRHADADGATHGWDRDRNGADREGAGSNGSTVAPDRPVDGGPRLTPPGSGSRFWLVSTIRRVIAKVCAEASCAMTPVTDLTGNFAIDLDLGQIGAMRISAREIWVQRKGDASLLQEIATAARRHLNMVSTEELAEKPVPKPRKKLLVLVESKDDVAACRRLSAGQPDVEVIVWHAPETFTNSESIEKIATALRKRQIAGCMLVTATSEGAATVLATHWRQLESVVQRRGVLEIATLTEGGGLQVLQTNAARLAQLEQDDDEMRPP